MEPAGPEAWFHIKGSFADKAQQLAMGATATFRSDGASLVATVDSTRLDMANLQITLGNSQRSPTVDEVLQLLDVSQQNAVVNLAGATLQDRPPFFRALLPRLNGGFR